MRYISDDEITSITREESIKVIDFWADWCIPCKAYAGVFEMAAERMPDVEFAKVNIDDSPNLTSLFGIKSIPTTIIIKNGKEVDRLIGIVNESELVDVVKKAK